MSRAAYELILTIACTAVAVLAIGSAWLLAIHP